ncbi:MAG: thioredoxin-like domain-containing protein [Chloroflexota bacterium]|nr:thioredoxin-like domain-containing protein [Chloroflexota bacterium]MDE2946817.1 thioredoxin-like domain-containing protein [Chloroflexota bacterium]
MKRLSLLLALALLTLGGVIQAQRTPKELFEGEVLAPEFPTHLDWINIDNPLTMSGLVGKIVIFDFWTYGCINCLHVIPVLEQVEKKYAEEVVVIGVHSAKFENEGQTENLRQIVQRYGIHHPVINDKDFDVWGSYGARAWPTIAVVDPRGYWVIRQSGEIPFEAFDNYLSGMIEYYDDIDAGIIDRTPLELALEGAGDPGTPLLYPGKVLADAAGGRLFIADSSHNRLVIADLMTHEVLDIIGSSARGADDGDFESATFDKPQGMALAGDLLYIADVNSHAIRVANLAERKVSTVAGNGVMGRQRLPFGLPITDPLSVSLRSPWDLEFDDGGRLHIAMAGTHQLYIYEPEAGVLYPSVGNGREANLNDVALADSELAQPSGLYYAGEGKLYFADSESSTIRLADFELDLVTVVSGTSNNHLFEYGDIDGELGQNRLQHALGVEGGPDGDIYIADTYNSRIKLIRAGESATHRAFGLGGLGGYADGDTSVAEFDEPGGISYADGILYVADTNNHVIRAIDLEAGIVDTLEFRNPEALVIDAQALTLLGGNRADEARVELETQRLAPGQGSISLQLAFPADFKINPLIDSLLEVSSSDGSVSSGVVDASEISLPVEWAEGAGQFTADLTLYYCREGAEALCFIETVQWIIPYEGAGDSARSDVTLRREISAPDL